MLRARLEPQVLLVRRVLRELQGQPGQQALQVRLVLLVQRGLQVLQVPQVRLVLLEPQALSVLRAWLVLQVRRLQVRQE